jgi:hypothetical protein
MSFNACIDPVVAVQSLFAVTQNLPSVHLGSPDIRACCQLRRYGREDGLSESDKAVVGRRKTHSQAETSAIDIRDSSAVSRELAKPRGTALRRFAKTSNGSRCSQLHSL